MLERADLIRLGLGALYHTRAHRALEPASRGIGVIFTLHRISAEREGNGVAEFAPNRILELGGDFLAATIERVRGHGLDIVPLDEARGRILGGDDRRFAVFTVDDGYRDTHERAWPIFQRHNCPFTLYVATGLIDRTVKLWWIALERIIAGADTIEASVSGRWLTLPCADADDKRAAFQALYWPLRAVGEAEKLDAITTLAERHGVSIAAIAEELGMTCEQLQEMARDPLVTIGAHTVSHAALARLDERTMRRELAYSRARLGELIGREPRHLAYPYGDAGSAGKREFAAAAELGFETGVTTRKGVVTRAHAAHLTALPRVSLNGNLQDVRFIDVLISGVPFALMRGFRQLNVN